MTTKQTSALQHTPESEALADAILKASGSALKHYSMQKTRDEIFAAAQAGINTAQAELLETLKHARDFISSVTPRNIGLPDDDILTLIDSIIARARGGQS